MMGGQKTAAAALLLAVFVAGVLGGVVGTQLVDGRVRRGDMEHRAPPLRPGGRPPMGGAWEGRPDRRGLSPMWLSDRLAEELDLSGDQRERVGEILDHRHKQTSALLEGVEPRLKAQFDSVQLEIREILTPGQQILFDRFREGEQERMFRRMTTQGDSSTASHPSPSPRFPPPRP